MTKEQEILDEFGKILIDTVFDFNYRMLTSNLARNLKNNTLESKIKPLSKDIIGSILFDFLKIFEENQQFKIYCEKDNKKIDLVEISEMLKAEPTIENGWIARFSKEVDKDEII